MRKRKSFFGLILMALVLVLGIGYAAVSSVDMTIGGSATIAEGNKTEMQVKFSNVTGDTDDTDGATSSGSITDFLSAKITANLTALGNSTTVTYQITNLEKGLKAKIDVKSIDVDQDDYFTVTTDIPSGGLVINADNGTGDVKVTVTLKKVPVEISSTTIEIELTATPVEL